MQKQTCAAQVSCCALTLSSQAAAPGLPPKPQPLRGSRTSSQAAPSGTLQIVHRRPLRGSQTPSLVAPSVRSQKRVSCATQQGNIVLHRCCILLRTPYVPQRSNIGGSNILGSTKSWLHFAIQACFWCRRGGPRPGGPAHSLLNRTLHGLCALPAQPHPMGPAQILHRCTLQLLRKHGDLQDALPVPVSPQRSTWTPVSGHVTPGTGQRSCKAKSAIMASCNIRACDPAFLSPHLRIYGVRGGFCFFLILLAQTVAL